MRILQIAPPWFAVPPTGYGGIERVVAILADGLTRAGHDVTLLASGASATRARRWSVFTDPPSLELGCPAPEIQHWMLAHSRRAEFDLIHNHCSLVGAALAAVMTGPPTVHTVHGPWTPHEAAAFLALPPTLHLVAISDYQARRAPAGLRIADVVPNGVDLAHFPFRGERRSGTGPLAFVGRANPDKGPDVALQVARRLRRPLRMSLKVNEAPEQDYFENVLRPLCRGVDVEIMVNSSAAEIAAEFAAADATLVPISWDEPFGLVMAESMACGTPVVAYRRGAASEIVADGETGFLVAPGDVDGLCAAVARTASLSPWACRAHVRRLFSGEAMVRRYTSLYERVLRRRQDTAVAVRPASAESAR